MKLRPFVFINMAISLDGKITSFKRERPQFSSNIDKQRMDQLRAKADAVLNGAESIRAEDPPLHIRDQALINERLAQGLSASPMPVIVTQSGHINPQAQCFTRTQKSIVATCDDTVLPVMHANTEVWRLGKNNVDMAQLLSKLKQNGVERLLLEGGGNIAWHFIEQQLVDELYVTIAPALLGGKDAPTLIDGHGFLMHEHLKLKLLNAEIIESEIFTHYQVLHRA